MSEERALKSRFAGMWQIVQFNRGFYLLGMVALVIGVVGLVVLRGWLSPALLLAGVVGLALAGWWLLGSLLVSHWVYDRSDWSKGGWTLAIVGNIPASTVMLNVHSGFDETTQRLREWFPDAQVTTLDLFDPQRLTEKSIHLARQMYPPSSDALKGSPEAWPVAEGTVDIVWFLLAAHEFRQHDERVALLKRSVEALSDKPGACVILAEHVRDVANFIAFGPGFMHFHSVKSWQRAWSEAGLQGEDQMKLTRFLRIWKLKPMKKKNL